MTKRFKLFKWEVEMSMGWSYWGNEPADAPVKASWSCGIRVDLNNRHKLQYNSDWSKVLTDDMRGCWVCFNDLCTAVLDYDADLQVLSARLKAKGLKGTYWRYPNSDYVHLH